jgi:3D (Asp-Asp-Asp) domain-containing protein
MKGKRKKVGYTASGTKARHGTIAADTSIYPFGTVMEVPGYGMGRVEDRGSAIRGNRIDLFFKKHRDAEDWGIRKKRVRIWIPR